MPPPAYETETAFWPALTGDQTHPLRIAIAARREEGPTRAWLELYCADREEAAAHHNACGATVLADTPQWIDLCDPAGGSYRLV
jgi:hypothetical protein